MKISRSIFISGPYKDCPACRKTNCYGVFMPISGNSAYQRECEKCGHTDSYDLPSIKKRIVYLDQFILSNLLKFLDSEHPSHEKVKSDPFWKELFIKLEHVSKAQAVVFPDSFYHKDESVAGDHVDFNLMKRLYEHFSSGKTLYPGFAIEKNQILHAFNSWIKDQQPSFEYNPESIAFDGDGLHKWSVGIGITVGGRPRDEEISDLKKRNRATKDWIAKIWEEWSRVGSFDFILAVKNEARALKQHLTNTYNFYKKQQDLMTKAQKGEDIDWNIDDIMPPISKDIFDGMYRICASNGIEDSEALSKMVQFFDDAEYLLEIPKIKISSVMYAGLARSASLGDKNPPKLIC